MKKILKEVYCKNCDITLEVAEDVCFCPECAYPLVETGKKIETGRKKKKEKQPLSPLAKRKIKTVSICLSLIVIIIGLFNGIYVVAPSIKYDNAIEYMNNKEYGKALEIWESLDIGYKDCAEKKEETETLYHLQQLSFAEVGDIVLLGEYEQDNETDNGKEDIEWLVLAREENKLLLISKYILDNTPYNDERVDVTWETCTARKFLNNGFYRIAFNEKIRESILTTSVKPAHNTKYEVSGGNQTEDKVFLLSLEEVKLYFDNEESRKASATRYAISKGTYSPDGCWWWLRNPFNDNDEALCVYYHGKANEDTCCPVHDDKCGVRPAMWVSINN